MHRPTPRASSPLTMIAASIVKTEQLSNDGGVSADQRCAYRSKPCTNARAVKVNGDLHKLCDHHRKRANINQQRVHLRRRLEKKHARQLQQRQAREATGVCFSAGLTPPDSPTTVDAAHLDASSELSMQDLVMLEFILAYEPPSRMGEAIEAKVDRLSFLEQLQCVV